MEDIVWSFIEYLKWVTDEYGTSLDVCILSLWHVVCGYFTVYNAAIFLLKYFPTGLYIYQFVKSIYVTSRERIKQKRVEMDEIQLQIQIVNTKISVRESEKEERVTRLRRCGQRLREARTRVHRILADLHHIHNLRDFQDLDHLQHLHDHYAQPDAVQQKQPPDEKPEQDMELLKRLLELMKRDEVVCSDEQSDNIEYVPAKDREDTEDIYPISSDNELSKNCHLKIIKVTKVYKVAYLKQYIKQKRLRRANRQAILKKKMENIKNLLEDWHKALSMVINSKLTLLNLNNHTTQEAMGDYSKLNLRETSDSENDLRNSNSDIFYDEYSTSWSQNQYRNYSYCYDDMTEPEESRNFYEPKEYGDSKSSNNHQCDVNDDVQSNVLSILPEETNSEIAIEENKCTDNNECHDLLIL